MKKLQYNVLMGALTLFAISILLGWPLGDDLSLFVRIIIFAGIVCFI